MPASVLTHGLTNLTRREGKEGSRGWSAAWEKRSKRSHSRVSWMPMGWVVVAGGMDTVRKVAKGRVPARNKEPTA